ncbi:MAG: SDR family NAD(P)-dependent oxidoreductase [Steroidobacteraceae bacterium]
MSWQKIIGAVIFYGRFSGSFTQLGYLGRRWRWPAFHPDFCGQHWLVTGASGGLGRELTRTALAAGATVTAAARDAQKLAILQRDLAAISDGRLRVETCDFSSIRETQSLIDRLVSQGQAVDVLMNNVGVLNHECVLTDEGYEGSFVSNLLSHYLLTERLSALQVLRPSSAIINMSSGGAYTVPLRTALLNVTESAQFNGVLAYAAHKRAQIVLTDHWRAEYGSQGIDCYVTHPGWVDTAGVQRSLPSFRKWYRPILRNSLSGVDTALWLAATRPQQAEAGIWFDRALRPAHIFSLTREGDSAEALVVALQHALKANPGAMAT